VHSLVIFFKEVKIELKKVNWPTRDQTVRYTLVVIGMSIAVTAFLGSLDFAFSYILNRFVFR